MEMIDLYERQKAALLEKYGLGVRPSWVSAELALLDYRIEKLKETPCKQSTSD